jgi:GTP-binding protein YchF
MRIGLFGYPGVGKTTLFNALTGAEAAARPGAKPEPHVGVARVPDARLDRLSAMFRPRRTTPAQVEFVDLVGFRRESASAAFEVEALKGADALAHVLRAFPEGLPHSEGAIDPARDAATMETELILADHAVIDRRVARLRGLVERGAGGEERAELQALERCLAHLEAEQPLRSLPRSPDEERRLRGFGLLSARPLLLVVNLPEARLADLADPAAAFALGAHAGRPDVAVCACSAQIEMEIARLAPDDARAFLEDLGLEAPASHRLIRSAYQLLGLESFFTVGEDECRAWTIRRGTPARQAAGVIHSDIERGFIRAEVVPYEDLVACGSLASARDRGRLRLEGKDYPVSDGDVVHFRFNV